MKRKVTKCYRAILDSGEKPTSSDYNLTTGHVSRCYIGPDCGDQVAEGTTSDVNPAATQSSASRATACRSAVTSVAAALPKVTLFLSFHKFQATSRNMESKIGRADESRRWRRRSHHSPISSSYSGTSIAKPTGDSSENHSSLAKTHPKNRCPIVSEFARPAGRLVSTSCALNKRPARRGVLTSIS